MQRRMSSPEATQSLWTPRRRSSELELLRGTTPARPADQPISTLAPTVTPVKRPVGPACIAGVRIQSATKGRSIQAALAEEFFRIRARAGVGLQRLRAAHFHEAGEACLRFS